MENSKAKIFGTVRKKDRRYFSTDEFATTKDKVINNVKTMFYMEASRANSKLESASPKASTVKN